MKRAWSVVSFVAVVNLMTIILVLGWAWITGRVDAERLSALQAVFNAPEAALDEARAVEPVVVSAAMEMPLSSTERLEWFNRWEMEQEQRVQQLVDEAERRTREVQAKLTALQQERLAFEAERARHRAAVESSSTADAEARFKQSVRLYERARPSTSKGWLLALVEDRGLHQAVRLLEAMDERAASRLLGAMNTEEEQKVATDLLNIMGGPDDMVQNQEMFSNAHDRNTDPVVP
ncbi:MAG: hypothetical protein MK095_01740 [Phycisphaerales bacterium]|nr:hypothetical protein [Phycisphaerales bacterium]